MAQRHTLNTSERAALNPSTTQQLVGNDCMAIAAKFASAGVDYKPAMHAFEATFDDAKTTEEN